VVVDVLEMYGKSPQSGNQAQWSNCLGNANSPSCCSRATQWSCLRKRLNLSNASFLKCSFLLVDIFDINGHWGQDTRLEKMQHVLYLY
jgi:hypothetical protein